MSLEERYPYPVGRITLSGHDCAYIDEGPKNGGDGNPMVFLHGFSVNLSCFSLNYPHFVKKHRVVGLDYPGYYLSEKKDLPYDVPFMADAVAELIEKLNLKRAVLVGSSMGGAIAIETALGRPDLVSALVLAAPGGFSGKNRLMAGLISLQVALLPRKMIVNTMYKRLPGRVPAFFADKKNPFIPAAIESYEEMKKRDDFSLWVLTLTRMAASLLRTDFSDRARLIKAPTLIVWGDRDEILPPAGAEAAKKAMGGNVRVVMIPGVGHVPFIEASDRFDRETDEFLASLGR